MSHCCAGLLGGCDTRTTYDVLLGSSDVNVKIWRRTEGFYAKLVEWEVSRNTGTSRNTEQKYRDSTEFVSAASRFRVELQKT